jgi:hypothetical protein
MTSHHSRSRPLLLDERSLPSFRTTFGALLSRSATVETAIRQIRLGAVDLSAGELNRLTRLRVLVAEVNAQTVEGEAYAMAVDPSKRKNLNRVLSLLRAGVLEIRSAPLGGWSPDFSVFSNRDGPQDLLLGLHWFHRPFPLRGPAWAIQLGPDEATAARSRFLEIWSSAHDIAPAIRRLVERTRPPEVVTSR